MTKTGPGEILFLAHRVPFPPDRGDKIRSHHLLLHLATLAPVHVACFGETQDDMAQDGALAKVSASHCLVQRRVSVAVAALQAVASGKPVSLTAFASPRIRRYVDHVLATRPITAIVGFSGQMAQYLPLRRGSRCADHFGGRIVMDFVDVDSAKFEAYAAAKLPPLSMLYRREALLMRQFEADVAARVDCSLLATNEEAELFASRLNGQPGSGGVCALHNGIDTVYFDPAGIPQEPALMRGGPHIVFTGQMDYPPNIEAVRHFAHTVMPAIRARLPHALFDVVGRAPTSAVRKLDGMNGTRVHGAVPDVRPWLAGADLVVAPLLIARGVQNKVLEAMAMARPVLATSAAATGIGAREGTDLVVADGSDALASAAIELLCDPVTALALGHAGRKFVLGSRGWARSLAPLAGLVLGDDRDHRDAA
ncbi:MAG: TIGR03087 family PEP-CTERM/XrtA system glycosyltransferase [Novosphingobium sp.]